MIKKTLIDRIICLVRNLRSKDLFFAIEKYCSGDVLDVGGWDFFLTIKNNKKISFDTWTNLEPNKERLFKIDDDRYKTIIGDGCSMMFEDNSFDTVLNIQVLEHVFEPIKMMNELGRVLKPGGYGIFLIPQTSVLHQSPNHFYNFTKFWIKKAVFKSGLEIVDLKHVGGFWSTTASHMVHFFFKVFRFPGYSTIDDKRVFLFYILLPFMFVYVFVGIIICMLFSFGDLTEDPNNYLIVVKK